MVKVITQETFDEVVKENIDEFDMSPDEALKEATAQFQAQGVDLSNIIKEITLGAGEKHLVSVAIEKLKELINTESSDDEAIVKELQVLKNECSKDLAYRVRAGKENAYDVLIKLLDSKLKHCKEEVTAKNGSHIVSVLSTLSALMDGQPDLLEPKGLELIKSILDNVKDDNILIETLKWMSVCCIKHETNRQKIFALNIIENFKKLLHNQKNTKLISETLNAMRKLTLDDDIRVEFGKAHEHSRELGTQLLEPLGGLLKEHTTPPLVSEVMLSMATVLVRNELCARAGDSAELLMTVLTDNYDNAAVVQQACKLIAALAGNDDVKRKLMKCGLAPILVTVMAKHVNNPTACVLFLKCIAVLCLREPTHSMELFQNGAAECVVNCMKQHLMDDRVQRNSAWAIRNMVARCKEESSKFIDLGVEELLNAAADRFSAQDKYDVKLALRDLECEVVFDEQWKGTGRQLEQ